MTRTPETRIWTVPNVLSGVRILGVAPLLWLAWRGGRTAFLALFGFLLLTDWLDGKLAVLLDQRTEWGPRLDSVADALMYGALALSFWWLEPDVVTAQLGWLVAALGTWIVSVGVGGVRFGRIPAYHTRGAKIGWFVVGAAGAYTIWSGDGRPVPWALGWVTLTNLEAVAVGLLLPEWRTDVPTFVHALRARWSKESAADGDDGPDEAERERRA